MSAIAVKKYAMVALSLLGSAILLFSCGSTKGESEGVNNETLMTERSENLAIVMSENGRRSYRFKTPLLEGYTMASDPYREFRQGIQITTYQDDSLSTVNSTLVANYAIYYENRELWEAKGDVVVEKADGTKLYTQQLFWNSKTGRIYSNVDSKIVKGTDVFMGEGFESDEELKEWRFRRMSGRMFVNMEATERADSTAADKPAESKKSDKEQPSKRTSKSNSAQQKSGAKSSGVEQRPASASSRNLHNESRPTSLPMRKSGISGEANVRKNQTLAPNKPRPRGANARTEMKIENGKAQKALPIALPENPTNEKEE